MSPFVEIGSSHIRFSRKYNASQPTPGKRIKMRKMSLDSSKPQYVGGTSTSLAASILNCSRASFASGTTILLLDIVFSPSFLLSILSIEGLRFFAGRYPICFESRMLSSGSDNIIDTARKYITAKLLSVFSRSVLTFQAHRCIIVLSSFEI